MNKMTFGEICFLVSFIGFAILIIKWLIYESQQSKEEETSECDGVEIVELFNKWKMKQENLI